MLNKHINFLTQVNINAATKLKKNIREYTIILKHFPRIGKKLYSDSELPLTYRKVVINKRYSLIYYIIRNNIYIDAILDSRQNNNYYKI